MANVGVSDAVQHSIVELTRPQTTPLLYIEQLMTDRRLSELHQTLLSSHFSANFTCQVGETRDLSPTLPTKGEDAFQWNAVAFENICNFDMAEQFWLIQFFLLVELFAVGTARS